MDYGNVHAHLVCVSKYHTSLLFEVYYCTPEQQLTLVLLMDGSFFLAVVLLNTNTEVIKIKTTDKYAEH